MLILTRRPGETIYIGDNVKITVVEIKGHQIRIGIDAPTELKIYREEIYLQILEENKKAAEAAMNVGAGVEANLAQLSQSWKGSTNLASFSNAGDEGEENKKKPDASAEGARQIKPGEAKIQVMLKKRKAKKSDE